MAWNKARTAKWLVVSVVVTIAGTALLWSLFGPGALFGFLFLPFLPFAFGRGARDRQHDGTDGWVGADAWRTCPRCDYGTRDPEVRYCPRDGSPLV